MELSCDILFSPLSYQYISDVLGQVEDTLHQQFSISAHTMPLKVYVNSLEELQGVLKFMIIFSSSFFAVYRLEEYCIKFVKKIVLSQHINRLPLPQPILDKISRTVT